MDYLDILKRSWSITWRHRILWLFGLLAGVSVGSSLNYQLSSRDMEGYLSSDGVWYAGDQLRELLVRHAALVVAAVAALLLLGLAAWVVSVAAHGGLIHLANEAAEGRPVRGRDGWAVGFRYWGRVFLLGLAVAVPMLLTVGLAVVAVALVVMPAIGSAGGDAEAAVAGAILGACCLAVVAVPVLIVVGFVVGGVYLLGLRYAILEDMGSFEALGAGWGAFRARWRNVFGVWVTLVIVGIVYGMGAGAVSLVFALPATFALLSGELLAFALLTLGATLVLLLPNAIYTALHSVTWTTFFRTLTGKDAAAAGPAPDAGTPASAPHLPPPPPPPAAPPPIVDA